VKRPLLPFDMESFPPAAAATGLNLYRHLAFPLMSQSYIKD